MAEEKSVGYQPLTPSDQYPYSLYCYLYISCGDDKENSFNIQSFLGWFMSLILMIFMNDSAVLLWGETRY